VTKRRQQDIMGRRKCGDTKLKGPQSVPPLFSIMVPIGARFGGQPTGFAETTYSVHGPFNGE
jgi:hypothetical protein